MGNFLQALGERAFLHKWRTLIIWLVLLAALGLAALHFITPTDGSISIPGTQAQKAIDRFSQLFPDAGKASGRIVFAAPAGKTINDYQSQINSITNAAAKAPDVTTVVSPLVNSAAVSKDGTIAYATVQINAEPGSAGLPTINAVSKAVKDGRTNGLEVEMGGDLINKVPGEIVGPGEISGVVVALIVLVITLGSLVAAGMPIIVALFAVGGSMAGLFSLSHVVSINSTTPALAVMLGLAVGIDYSLFIISRYRALLLEGYSYKQAVGRAIATAGNAVIFAAATVVIALSALSIVQIPFMTTMGLSGAGTVALAAIVAITLIPALLGIAGKKIFAGKTRRLIAEAQAKGPHHTEHVKHQTFWYHWGSAITRHPIIILIVAVIVLVVIALPVRQLTLGLPIDEYAATSSTQRKAYDLVSKGFGIGANAPLVIVVEGLPATSAADTTAVKDSILAPYASELSAMPAAQKQLLTTQADTQALAYAPYYQLKLVADQIAKLGDVDQALPILTTDNGTKGVIQVTPKSAPSAKATIDLISYLRNTTNEKTLTKSSNVTFGITGTTAIQNDINEKLTAALPEYLAVVIGLSFILLTIAFRSILVPIKATLGFLLSVLAMFGTLVAVFQWGWFGIADAPGPLISFVPILAIGILFGLAMDYEFFLVSSIHEAHLHTKDANKAVMRGFSLGSKVVTAAGIIMISVFAGFISNSDTTIQSIGFGLSVGILIDAFIVRMTIVPAVMTLLGNHAWWVPKWLDRILPHLSIEGSDDNK